MASPKPLLYIQREGAEAGPYDLVQMAGLFRKKVISGETQSRLEGEDSWMPLSWQPHFSIIREMSPNAVSMRLDELDEETLDRQSPIPLPSREALAKAGVILGGCLLAGVGSFLLAWLNIALGTALIYGGLGVALAAQVLIILKMIDQDYWKLFLTMIVPLYDFYFFICNIERYYQLLAVKYAGICIALGAAWGLGRHV